MSRRQDGTIRCDGTCPEGGVIFNNGGVAEATVIVTVDRENPTEPVTLHLCRVPRKGAPHGCEGHVLSAKKLRNHYETRSS